MNCFFANHQFSAYLDERLREETRLELEKHLGECGSCRQQLDELRQVLARLRCAPRPTADLALRSKIRFRLTKAKIERPWTQRYLLSPFTLLIGCVSVFVILTTLSWWRRPLTTVEAPVENINVPAPTATATPEPTPAQIPAPVGAKPRALRGDWNTLQPDLGTGGGSARGRPRLKPRASVGDWGTALPKPTESR